MVQGLEAHHIPWLIGLVVFLGFLLAPLWKRQRKAKPQPKDDTDLKVGLTTGLLGGDIEDAAVARYALSRKEGQPSNQDVGMASALSTQIEE